MFARRRKPKLQETIHRSVWPKTGWRRALTYFWKRIVRLSASPHAVAAGAAAGTFASFTPFMGFHILLAFLIAFLLRGNMLAAALGTAVGNPLTFPLIWAATYEVGRWILSGGSDPINTERTVAPGQQMIEKGLLEIGIDRIWPIMKPMAVGSIPLGLLAATAVYLVTLGAVSGLQKRRRARLERDDEIGVSRGAEG